MRTRLPKLVFAAAALIAAIGTAPLSAAFADSMTSPNSVNNATVDPTMAHQGSTGIYDTEDQFNNAQGFPQPGWQFLSRPPS